MMELADFNRYNPDFDKVMASASNSYEIKLPPEKMELFNANKYQILNESIQLLLTSASGNTAANGQQKTVCRWQQKWQRNNQVILVESHPVCMNSGGFFITTKKLFLLLLLSISILRIPRRLRC